jgi:hypothetical protein
MNNYILNGVDSNFNILYNSNSIISYSINSNIIYSILYGDQYANNYFFNSNNCSFINNSNDINYNASSHIFNGDVKINGNIDAIFPPYLLQLNSNNKIDDSFINSYSNYYRLNTINNGDFIVNNGRIGINTDIPAYSFHLNDNQNFLPSFVLSSNNIKNFIAYANKPCIGIGTTNISDNTISLYSSGTIFTKDLKINKNGNLLLYYDVNSNLILNSGVYINSIINSNLQINGDIKLNNNSLNKIINYTSNLSILCNPDNNKLNFNNKISIGLENNSFVINDNNNGLKYCNDTLYIDNIITSNINSLNLKGTLKLFNETKFPINIYTNYNNNIYFLDNNLNLYYYNKYDINPTLLKNNITNFNTKFNSIVYKDINSNIYYNDILFSNINISNYSFDNDAIYYIDNNFNLYYQGKNFNTKTNFSRDIITTNNFSNINYNNIKFKIVDSGNNFVSIVDTSNLIYTFGYNNLNQLGRTTTYLYDSIDIINNNRNNIEIVKISSGETHVLVLYKDGLVFSFGDTINNNTNKKGYSTNTIFLNKIDIVNNEFITNIYCSYNNSILLTKNNDVYVFGNINNNLNKLQNIPKIIDLCCGYNNCILLSENNSILTFNNLENDNEGTGRLTNSTIPSLLTMPNDFYGISVKSKGSIVIGTKFYNTEIPKNSLVVENFIGIGTTLNYDLNNNNYSLIVSGNVNVINGNIYKNGTLFTGSSGFNNAVSFWNNRSSNIYFNNGFVGIGTNNPSKTLDVVGDFSVTGSFYVNNKSLSLILSLWNNTNYSIYYNEPASKVGINTDNPSSGFHIYDTSFSVNNVLYSSNSIYIDTITSNIVFNSDVNFIFDNPIAISGDGKTIVQSYYKNYNMTFTNNNIFVYSNINNNWIKNTIYSPIKNITFGNDIKVSYDGSTIVVGCYDDYNLINSSRINKGSFYVYNNYSYDSCNIINYLPNYGISTKFAISKNANIISSFIFNDYYNIYVYNNHSYLINFNSYLFHTSFENCCIDMNYDGSIIVATFNVNDSYLNFEYMPIYIITDNSIRFIKINQNNNNFTVNNVSISADGTKILISVKDNNLYKNNYDIGYFYILDDSLLYDNVYNIPIPNYTITLNHNFNYNSKLSKNANFIYSTPIYNDTKNTYSFKYDNVNNIWIQHNLEPLNYSLLTLNNINKDLSYNGYTNVLSVLYIDVNNNLAKSDIFYNNLYYDKTILYNYGGLLSLSSNVLNDKYDISLCGSNYINFTKIDTLYTKGQNIKDIPLSNIITYNSEHTHLFFNSNNLVSYNSNLYWNNDSNMLRVEGDIFCSNLDTYLNLSQIKKYSILSLINGGTGISNVDIGQIPFGYLSNCLNTSSNILWDNDTSNFYINGTINSIDNYSTYFYGNGFNITRINSANIVGIISHIHGGLGINDIPTGYIPFGNTSNSMNITNNLFWDNTSNNLCINGNLLVCSNIYSTYIGDGFNISNINTSNFNGIININNGGTGLSNINNGSVMIGNGNDSVLTSSNLLWTNDDKLIVNGYIYSCNFSGDGSKLINIQTSNFTGRVSMNNGGLGNLIINKGNFVIGNDTNFISSTELYLENTNLFMYGDIYSSNIYSSFIGNGYNISNINTSNFNGIISINNGGTGLSNITIGSIMIGNDNNPIYTTSNLYWDINNDVLNSLNLIVSSSLNVKNIICNTKYINNINFNEILNVSNGGSGLSNVANGTLLIGNSSNPLFSTSNLLWNEANSNLIVNGTITTKDIIAKYFIGDATYCSNIITSNIIGILNIKNGGTGHSNIAKGTLLIGNNNNPLFSTSNLIWDDVNSNLIINNTIITKNTISKYFIGDSTYCSNIITSNIIGILDIKNGGTGLSNIAKGTLLIGNSNNSLFSTSNLMWNDVNSNLIVNGTIKTNDIVANYFIGDATYCSNIITSNIKGILSLNNGGLGVNNFPFGQILYGNNNNTITSTPNYKWNTLNNTLNIIGNLNISNIYANNIYGNGSNISNILTCNIVGILNTSNGGTGMSNIPFGTILVGNNDLSYTSNLLFINNKLGINVINNPVYDLDINGDINFTGNIYNKSSIYVPNLGWSNIISYKTISTSCNVLVGYDTPDSNYSLKVLGNIYASGDITALSDERFKKNIEPITNALYKVEQLNGVYFNRINVLDKKKYIGLIAQEVEKIVPEVITDSSISGKSIAYGNLVSLLIESIKELSEKIKYIEKHLFIDSNMDCR